VADLAAELERALAEAAEANEQLRKDLGIALDDLARATADRKRLQERVDKQDGDSRERSAVLQDLVREMELLEGERDAALTQASDATFAHEEMREKILLAERRVHDVEKALSEAQARNRRLEEASQASNAARVAIRAEMETLRRERDAMVARLAEMEREHEDLTKSRHALDEVSRRLSEARARAQRIRPR
jgi:chromosome segregation ATPase